MLSAMKINRATKVVQKGKGLYLCRNLKTFGKMKTILWIIAIGAAFIGEFHVTLGTITILIIAHFYKPTNNKDDDDCSYLE